MILQANAFLRPFISSRAILRVTLPDVYLMKRKLSNSAEPLVSKRSKMATAKITLTPREAQLRDLLLDVARYIDESKEIKEKIELRFAGGWVRDKLLNIPSHDIDTAINAMTGLSFGMKVREYLEDAENLEKHSLRTEDVKKLYTIAANPEKSKHLETATTIIYGFDVDFVNLRKETYSEGNRNPQVEFGTPKEDSERRDATINALFYNLHTDEVEDFEGGLEDMAAKRIKTPLDPKKTFKDDPLRVLRLIRFASRLDFNIDPESEKYMSDPEIMKALETMISRERVGVEVEKMLKGNNPKRSLEYFDRLRLYSTVFTIPTKDCSSPNTTSWFIAYNCLALLQKNSTPGSLFQTLVRSDDDKYLAWILAALSPWCSVENPPLKKTGGRTDPVATEVAREGLRLESKNCAIVTGAFRNQKTILAAKNAVAESQPWVQERDTFGMMIREWGANWKLQTLLAIIVEAMMQDLSPNPDSKNDSSDFYQPIFCVWQAFIDHIEELDLMHVATQKYPMTGTVLSKALGIKPGEWMKRALNVCMEWQLRNPESENIQEAVEEVRKRSEELGLPAK